MWWLYFIIILIQGILFTGFARRIAIIAPIQMLFGWFKSITPALSIHCIMNKFEQGDASLQLNYVQQVFIIIYLIIYSTGIITTHIQKQKQV